MLEGSALSVMLVAVALTETRVQGPMVFRLRVSRYSTAYSVIPVVTSGADQLTRVEPRLFETESVRGAVGKDAA